MIFFFDMFTILTSRRYCQREQIKEEIFAKKGRGEERSRGLKAYEGGNLTPSRRKQGRTYRAHTI